MSSPKVDRVQFMTLINTIPDNAPLLAAALDEVSMPEKVCSLAGFDTVAVISRTNEDAIKLTEYIKSHAILLRIEKDTSGKHIGCRWYLFFFIYILSGACNPNRRKSSLTRLLQRKPMPIEHLLRIFC